MPSDFPRSPRLLKGALVVYESHSQGPPPRIIVFQYNPEELSRTLQKRAPEKKRGNAGAAKEDVLRAQGPPEETIKLTVELDAADQLAEPGNNKIVVDHGLHTALAALEMVDRVVFFSEDTPGNVIDAIVPDVLVKGADYALDEIVGRDTVERAGGRVVRGPLTSGRSTQSLIRTVLERSANKELEPGKEAS